MTGTSDELKQAWIKAWVAYGFGDYEVASKRFNIWLKRFLAERKPMSAYWSSRMLSNCEQLMSEIERHVKPVRRSSQQADQQRMNSAFWAGRHLMVMLSRQEQTMEGAVAIVKAPPPSIESFVQAKPAPAPVSRQAPAPKQAPPPAARPVAPPPPPVIAAPPALPVKEKPAPIAPPPPVVVPEVTKEPAPEVVSEDLSLDLGEDLDDLSLDDLDLSELDAADLDLGDLDIDESALEGLDLEGLEGLEGLDGIDMEGLEDLDLEDSV